MRPVQPRLRPLVDAGGVSATDIIMNLFIFFFIAFSLLATFQKPKASKAEEGRLDIELPVSGSATAAKAKAVTVRLAKDGRRYIDEVEVRREAYAERLGAAVAAAVVGGGGAVLVRSDKDVPLGEVVAAMDVARRAGATTLAIATVQPD